MSFFSSFLQVEVIVVGLPFIAVNGKLHQIYIYFFICSESKEKKSQYYCFHDFRVNGKRLIIAVTINMNICIHVNGKIFMLLMTINTSYQSL